MDRRQGSGQGARPPAQLGGGEEGSRFAGPAFEEAFRHLERAAERVDAATPAERAERAELLELRGSAERSAGHWPESIATLHQAVDAYEALGDEEAVVRVGLQAAYSLLWPRRS